MQRKRAFTLIELLVVIAIISILAAMLFPVFAEARAAARKSLAMSNMRQIGMAAGLYADDYDETYPMTMFLDPSNPTVPLTISWWAIHNYQEALNPYIKMGRGTQNRTSVWWDPSDPDNGNGYIWGSFTHNGIITGVVRRRAEVARHSDTIFATLRARDWHLVTETPLPASPPPADDPFWISAYFDMCIDPWEAHGDASHPYHWSTGRAAPPCYLFPNDPHCWSWDVAADKTRYGRGTLFSYLDGRVKWGRFEQTYRSPQDNEWDIW